MKQYTWKVKIGDLLHSIGKVDEIVFEERYIHGYDELCKPGISWNCSLQAINKTSIQVTLSNITCTVTDISDLSSEEYTRKVFVEEYEALYVFPEEEKNIETIYKSYNDIYYIHMKDFSIDLEDCVLNTIRSQDPIVKQKDDERLWEWWIEVVDSYEI